VEAALVIASPADQQQILLRRCGPDERWAGLWDFPRFSVSTEQQQHLRDELKERMQSAACLDIEPLQFLARIKHGVTRYRITLLCYQGVIARNGNCQLPQNWRWIARSDLDAIPLSSTGRRICKMLKNPAPQA
jgi:A/G-specific adenine glycosylase